MRLLILLTMFISPIFSQEIVEFTDAPSWLQNTSWCHVDKKTNKKIVVEFFNSTVMQKQIENNNIIDSHLSSIKFNPISDNITFSYDLESNSSLVLELLNSTTLIFHATGTKPQKITFKLIK